MSTVEFNLDFLQSLISDVPFPRIVRAEQDFDSAHIEPAEMEELTYQKLLASSGIQNIQPGQRIAITCGSRGISGYLEMTRAAVRAVKTRGGEPFLVPAMGSHGGATAEGQRAMVEALGVTEEKAGAPILSSMETDFIGETSDGRPVYLDHHANQADGIILVNRVKCHTSFRGPYESGLMKMMAIGLGKREGAQHYHQTGFGSMSNVIESVGKLVLEKAKIICGVAMVENSFGKAVHIEALEPAEIPSRELKLLELANTYLPKLFCNQLDVCCIQKIGKDISGTGMDTNVVGRFPLHPEVGAQVTRIAVLNLTDISHGNANGMGRADVISKRLFDKANLSQFYPNSITSTALESAKIPMIAPNDKAALAICIKTSTLIDFTKVRLVLIESTKNMRALYISESMIPEAQANHVRIVGDPFEIPFDTDGTLKLDYS